MIHFGLFMNENTNGFSATTNGLTNPRVSLKVDATVEMSFVKMNLNSNVEFTMVHFGYYFVWKFIRL